ncbi:MAG: UDP-2,3-diacylglucosamine diphosphatase LpxI [Planctomycetaceae bacterium]
MLIPMTSTLPQHAPRMGLLAGSGRFPMTVADSLRRQGYFVHGQGVMGMADPGLAAHCDRYSEAPIARLGKAIRTFRRAGIQQVIMAGKIEKTVLFRKWRWLRLLPDWRTLHMWWGYARRDRKDDTLLLAVIKEFARDNIEFVSAVEYCPEILVKHGFLTQRRPTPAQWDDIHFGWEIAKEVGRLDIGQTVIVNDKAVIAVEAIEGTDQAIKRAGLLCKRGGFTVVKVAKPQQDLRFDMPTIGVQTLHSMHESGGRVLAIESGMTILLDQPEFIELAERFRIAVVSLNAQELQMKMAS